MIGAIVELADKDGYESNNDPKIALRLGFSSVNRLTQFMTPRTTSQNGKEESENGIAHRAKSSWLDLFRQLGISIPLPKSDPLGLPNSVNAVGLWLIKRTKTNSPNCKPGVLPVAVCVNTANRAVSARINGLDGLYSYSEALVAIGRGEGEYVADEKSAQPYIKQLLDELKDFGDVLLLCDKHNMGYQAWPWLNNKNIGKDKVGIAYELSVPIEEYGKLRIVRGRGGSASLESPQWYRVSVKDSKTMISKGLWDISDRVYGSTYGKPTQMKGISHHTSKIGTWENSNGRSFDPQPRKPLQNPSMYELTVACVQPGDDPAAWAALAHMLRDSAVHYADANVRPYPLLLAERIEEYAHPFEFGAAQKNKSKQSQKRLLT